MVYQGSKSRLAKELLPIIHRYITDYGIDTYIELMVGGANLIDKVDCPHKIGCDINPNLITLLQYVQSDPDISIAPDSCSFEHYKDVRENQHTGKYTPEYVSLIGYCASYAGRYFDGGYGRDKKGNRNIFHERVLNLKEQAKNLKGIDFRRCDYREFPIHEYKNALFYLDPPYRDTKQYAKQQIDYDEFYNFCRELSKNNIVLISEYTMPSDFTCIWSKPVKVLQKSDRVEGDTAVEKLFVVGGVPIQQQFKLF